MQPPGPPRPFRGTQYDKDMFTFLPAGLNRDALPESSRKRKLNSSDYQTTVPSNVRRGVSDHELNGNDSQDKRTLNSSPALRSSESSNFRGYPDQSQYWHQNAERQDHNERGFYESGSDYTSFSTPLQSPNHKVSSSLYPTMIKDFNEHDNCDSNSHVATHKGPNWAPLLTEDFNLCENSNLKSHVATHKPLDWQPPVTQELYQHEKRESDVVIVVPTSSNAPPSTTKDSFLHGNCDLSTHVTTHKTSNGAPLVTQDANHHENHESNAHVARVENNPLLREFEFGSNQQPVQLRAITSDLYERASTILAELHKVPQNNLNPRAASGGLDEEGRHEEEIYKVDCPSNVSQIATGSIFGIDSHKTTGNNTSTSVYNLQTETNNLLNVLRLLSAASGIGIPENNDGKIQDSEHDVKMINSTLGSAIQHLKHPPQAESTVLKKHEDGHYLGIPAENVEKGSLKVDGECKLDDRALTLGEKLWDGTVKLSTSVLVSVIGFFKSGEKMQDSSWSDIVEVKGKVRLEAFEKYVQDLPRSRSRGLMVMSLCPKDGPSNDGHKSMNEVAKKYRDQRKVGFAKLSTDVDLYICPHSDAIIAILIKHSFCKGMTYIEDQNVPLLGCVVWKKNSVSVHSKHAEVLTVEKEQMSTGGVDNNSRDKSPEFLSSPRAHQPKLSPVSHNRLNSGELSPVSHKPVLPIPSVASKTSVDLSDDDDLPEYDFRAAISQASVSKASEIESHKPSSEGPAPKNLEQQSEVKMPSLPIEEQKPVEKGVESLKTRNLFDDDDDMPEWCPPAFMATKKAEPSYSMSNSNVSSSGFADLTSGVMLPPPPPPPPLVQMQLQSKNQYSSPLVLPPPPPLTQLQLLGKNHPSAPRALPPPPPMTQMQVQGNNNPNPSAHLPKPPAIGFNPETPVAMSTQLSIKAGNYPRPPMTQIHSGGKIYSLSPRPPGPLSDKSSSDGVNSEYPAFPPGFAPNPALRPCFDLPGTKNGIRPSTWSRRP